MRKYRAIYFLVVMLVCRPILAQSAKESNLQQFFTKIEAYLAVKGKVLVEDFYRIGRVHGSGNFMEFSAVVIYEPALESERLRGLKITIRGDGLDRSSYLDFDEVETFSKAVDDLIKMSSIWKTEQREYTEATFSTKGGFRIGFFQEGVEQTCFSESGIIGKKSCFFDINNLGAVKRIIENADTLLAQK